MSIQDIVEDVERWCDEGADIALATVVKTWGSGPRRPGAKMALTSDSRLTGSVSGGCVESAVVEEGKEVLKTREPKLLTFGVADETAWDVGLSCGGTIEIFVEVLKEEVFGALATAFREERGIAKGTVISGVDAGKTIIVTNETSSDVGIEALAHQVLRAGRSDSVVLEDDSVVFIDVELPRPVLIMVGGVHVAVALTSVANSLGYRTVVVDPRGVFCSEERFSHASKIVRAWPDDALRTIGINRSTAVATLTHDPKLDDPALEVALSSDAFYVGALGSRRTHDKRCKRLSDRGVSNGDLARIKAPIGLSIGSRSPEEISLSIMGEIVATRNGVEL